MRKRSIRKSSKRKSRTGSKHKKSGKKIIHRSIKKRSSHRKRKSSFRKYSFSPKMSIVSKLQDMTTFYSVKELEEGHDYEYDKMYNDAVKSALENIGLKCIKPRHLKSGKYVDPSDSDDKYYKKTGSKWDACTLHIILTYMKINNIKNASDVPVNNVVKYILDSINNNENVKQLSKKLGNPPVGSYTVKTKGNPYAGTEDLMLVSKVLNAKHLHTRIKDFISDNKDFLNKNYEQLSSDKEALEKVKDESE
jgi:hypothetical protein